MSDSAMLLHFRHPRLPLTSRDAEIIFLAGYPEEVDEAIAWSQGEGYALVAQHRLRNLDADFNLLPIGRPWRVGK